MAGLTDRASGIPPGPERALEEARRRWEASMLAEIERLRDSLRERSVDFVGRNIDAAVIEAELRFRYWERDVVVSWSDLQPRGTEGDHLNPFDSAMVLHHMATSDGSPIEGQWIGFRDLPGGEFYHQAYLGYTGRRLAEAFGSEPSRFDAAAQRLGGLRLDGPSPHTWAFTPLPRIPLAACLWPGDEDLAAQAAVLFDAGAARQMPIDGMALLGAGLTGRLIAASANS
jgi:hypothetical protein